MAYNELFALAFVAPYVASEKKIPPTVVQEMMRRSLYHIKWYFAKTDLNTDKGKAENKKSVVKYAKWYTPEKEAKYPTSFKVDFVGQPYEGACYYRITRCPICIYTEKLSVSELMPLFCELDEVMITLQHGILHRKQALPAVQVIGKRFSIACHTTRCRHTRQKGSQKVRHRQKDSFPAQLASAHSGSLRRISAPLRERRRDGSPFFLRCLRKNSTVLLF